MSFRLRALALLVVLAGAAAALELPPGEPMVLPGEPIQDEFNRRWNFTEDGSLAEEDEDQGGLFDFAGRLLVANQPFTGGAQVQSLRQPGVVDPWLVLGPQACDGNLEIARFIHLSRKDGVCRYLEVVANNSKERRQVPLRIQHELKWSPRALEWRKDERNATVGAVLHFGTRRVGAVACWWGAELRVTAREGNSTTTLDTVLDLGPGESVGVIHVVAVRPQLEDAQKLLKGWNAEQLGKGLPWLPDLKILNLRVGTTAIDALRAPGIDTVLLIHGERLRGTVMTPSFDVKGSLGSFTIPRGDLAGISRCADGQFALFCGDGSVISGALVPDKIALALPTGDELAIPLAEVRVLALRAKGDDSHPTPAPTGGWELTTLDQQRFFVKDLAGPLAVVTAVGNLEIPRDALVSVEGYRQGPLTIELGDGSRLHALGSSATIAMIGTSGNAIALPLARLRRLHRQGEPPAGNGADNAVTVSLSNGDVLRGVLVKPLVLATKYRTVTIQPEQVRGVSVDGGKAQTTVHFADGSYLQGRLSEDLELELAWKVRLRLPQGWLSGIGTNPGASAQKQIEVEAKAMLRDLANPDAAKANVAGAWLAQHRVQLRDFLTRCYDGNDLSESARRRLGLIIGREF